MKKELIPIIEYWQLNCPKCNATQIIDYGENTGLCSICGEIFDAKDQLQKQHPETYKLYFEDKKK